MGRLQGKVALVTGAARGQGRAHAIRMAEEGADIIAVDICAAVETVPYEAATREELEVTAKEVEVRGRKVVSRAADVRDYPVLKATVEEGVAELGRLDVVVANAGIWSHAPSHEMPEAQWQAMIDVNLTGVWHTTKAATPIMIEQGSGGSMILISSTAGLMGFPNMAHYTAAKHGVTGLTKTLAAELGPHNIRVNSIHPTGVLTKMVDNDTMFRLFRPDLENPGIDEAAEALAQLNILPLPWMDPVEISHSVVFLASEEAKYITGVALPVDAGSTQK
ncbi:MAG: mycofactocin-coupled SDR family oxidoreductase [Haloechinothrix sp.]